jgi:hypothetical protein
MTPLRSAAMDKRMKKRMDALRKRIQKLHLQVAGARKQADDPAEVAVFEAQLEAAEAELKKLKES